MSYTKHNIVNGQYVHIEQTPASIGNRIGAALIDLALTYFYYNAVPFLFIGISSRSHSMADGWDITLLAIIILLPILYAPLCEQFLNGATFGKMALKMRVVMQNGEPVSIGSSILRALLKMIDTSFFMVGLLVMFCNKKNMRLGDMAAGTIVIRESSRQQDRQAKSLIHEFTYLRDDYQPTYPFASEMTWGQIDFINHTMLRRDQYVYEPNQKQNINLLAQKIASKYNVEGINETNSNKFLRAIVADYNFYTWNDTV